MHRRALGLWCTLILVLAPVAAASGATAPPPPSDLAEEVQQRLEGENLVEGDLHFIAVEGEVITLCLDLPAETLNRLDEVAAERLEATVAGSLLALDWRSLHLHALDPATGACQPLSDFLPGASQDPLSFARATAPIKPYVTSSSTPLLSLAGKTIYVSAGHGWQWNGSAWRTQRPPYQDIIEDHNNAEAVAQYLIPYLERAGATVVPVRERDWNAGRVIADNDQPLVYADAGGWETSALPGYDGGSYRFTTTTALSSTTVATATWTLDVPQTGRYALYAWMVPGANRVPDARYTVRHAGGESEVYLDQRIRPETWRYLGTFPFYTGTTSVILDNLSTVTGTYVVADALRLGGGLFDDLDGIDTTAPAAPDEPWWEVATFYYSQWMGMDQPYGDVTARPIFSRWYHAGVEEDAIYVSWHTNGYNGDNDVVWGTVSYVHNEETYPRTEGSSELQQAIHEELVSDIRAGWDAEWRDLGERALNLGELRLLWDDDPSNRMPGVLLELAYHDHVEDAQALKDPRFNRLAARAVYQGILHYFEVRDGVDLVEAPEPPASLRVQNLGQGAVRIAWSPSPTDTLGLQGDAATEYRLYTSPDGFAWGEPLAVSAPEATLTGLTPGQTLYVQVTAVNEGGESFPFPTEVLGARVGDDVPLLIVNGFDKLNRFGLVQEVDPTEGFNLRMWEAQINSRDYVVHHGESVPDTYAWDSASNEAVAEALVDLRDYPMVDWILGEESAEENGTLNPEERLALDAFVEGGGSLLISGTELAWELATTDPGFLTGTLHVDFAADDAETYAVLPVAGGVFDGLAPLTFYTPGEYDADFPDVLNPTGGAVLALTYGGGTGGGAGVQFAEGCSRRLVLGFPLETVDPAARGLLMARALDYLDACAFVETEIAPLETAYLTTVPAFAGASSGSGITRLEVQVQRDEDLAFWDGAGWGPSRWLMADGVESWSYSLPPLEDATYTLRARAVGVFVERTPAEITFTLDRAAPLTPEIVAPLGGISLANAPVFLSWTAPPDDGSPLVYEVEIDNEVATVEETEVSRTLEPGEHRWRVRARDAAGNISPWSAYETFIVAASGDWVSLYLPQALKMALPAPETCITLVSSGFETVEDWHYNNLAVRVGDLVRSGIWAGRVGIVPGTSGGGSVSYSSLSRDLALPGTGEQLRLSFWVYPIAEGEDPGDLHYVSLRDGDGRLHTLSTHTTDGRAWEARDLDLSPYAGQSVTLYLGAKNDGDDDTAALYVDDVMLESCPYP